MENSEIHYTGGIGSPTNVYGVRVDEALHALHFPLDNEDAIPVDFGLIYKKIFESRRLFSIVSDYTKEPPRLHTYSLADQDRSRQRMIRIDSEAE